MEINRAKLRLLGKLSSKAEKLNRFIFAVALSRKYSEPAHCAFSTIEQRCPELPDFNYSAQPVTS